MFKNYAYVSSTSATGRQFFQANAVACITKTGLKKGKVLDIACNDGAQLDCFRGQGWTTYGVDPAENLKPASEAKGHVVVCDYWTVPVAKQLAAAAGPMDIILAQNVFAHTQHVDAFLEAAKLLMADKTDLYIQTSQRNMIPNGEFDTIYHEHMSFFSANSMRVLLQRHGLWIHEISLPAIHGNSFIFHVRNSASSDCQRMAVDQAIEDEAKRGLHSLSASQKFRHDAMRSRRLRRGSKGYDCSRAWQH
jgi:hypothetical protein